MNPEETITIWMANTFILDQTTFIRQSPVFLKKTGVLFLAGWKAEMIVNQAKAKGIVPDLSNSKQFPLCVYHVRKKRLLSEKLTLKEQNVENGDVLVLIETDEENAQNYTGIINDKFPNKIEIDVPNHISHLSPADLYELTKSTQEEKVKNILYLAANPKDQEQLRLGDEVRKINNIFRHSDYYKLIQEWSAGPEDISQALIDYRPYILHFSGHGKSTGSLCFQNESGETHPISTFALTMLFEPFKNDLKCVVLNACYSAEQASKISEHIDYVIGMDAKIGNEASIAFSVGFYQGIKGNRSIEDSFKLGRAQIAAKNKPAQHLFAQTYPKSNIIIKNSNAIYPCASSIKSTIMN